MKDRILRVLRNKKFWAAVAVSVVAAGGSVNPQAVVATGEVIGAVLEVIEAPESGK
mgnify:CR=1 FL=1